MASSIDPEPDQRVSTLQVGQDSAGHWLVQESGRRLEGRFVSFSSAMAYAHSECHSFPGAVIVLSSTPLVPIVPFSPVQPWERAVPRRASAPALEAAA